MNGKYIFLWGLTFLLLPGAWAQDAKSEYVRQLSSAFAKDGLAIESGMGTDGTQNLAVLARRGYFPVTLLGKAEVPTVLRIYTDKTYDCSRAFLLPDLKKRVVLPVKGVTAFTLPPQKKGSTLFGTCGMGMYTFEIRFE